MSLQPTYPPTRSNISTQSMLRLISTSCGNGLLLVTFVFSMSQRRPSLLISSPKGRPTSVFTEFRSRLTTCSSDVSTGWRGALREIFPSFDRDSLWLSHSRPPVNHACTNGMWSAPPWCCCYKSGWLLPWSHLYILYPWLPGMLCNQYNTIILLSIHMVRLWLVTS